MRRPFWQISAALLLVLLALSLPAAVTQIAGPNFAVPVGWEVELTIVHSLGADYYSGQWRCLECDPASAWTPDPAETQGAATFLRTLNQVGTYEFKGGAHEQTGPIDSENPFTWSYLTRQVEVIGPDWDTVSTPQDSYASPENPTFMGMDVLFYLYAGSLAIGSTVTAEAQERIYINGQWSDWVGSEAGIFEFFDGMIYDFKTVVINNQSWWDSQPNGTILLDYYQQNRVIIDDCAGIPQYYILSMHNFRQEKLGASSWRLYEVQE